MFIDNLAARDDYLKKKATQSPKYTYVPWSNQTIPLFHSTNFSINCFCWTVFCYDTNRDYTRNSLWNSLWNNSLLRIILLYYTVSGGATPCGNFLVWYYWKKFCISKNNWLFLSYGHQELHNWFNFPFQFGC